MAESERLKALENLREGAWRELDSLRNHEWKFAITLWSSLAVLIGSILIQPVNFSLGWRILAILAGIIIIVLHGRYLLGVARNQNLNRLQQIFFRNKIMSLLTIEYDEKIKNEIKKIDKEKENREKYKQFGPFMHWSTGFQILFTLFLVAVAIFAVVSPLKNQDQNVTVPEEAMNPIIHLINAAFALATIIVGVNLTKTGIIKKTAPINEEVRWPWLPVLLGCILILGAVVFIAVT